MCEYREGAPGWPEGYPFLIGSGFDVRPPDLCSRSGAIPWVFGEEFAGETANLAILIPIGSVLLILASFMAKIVNAAGKKLPVGSIWRYSMAAEFGKQIGKFVRERRKAAGLSQQALGDLAGVGRRFVSELEQAKPTVRLDSVSLVLSVFGKTLGIVDLPKVESA